MDPTIRVLLLEDDPADVRLIRTYLREENDVPLVIQETHRLSDGLERLRRSAVDVVLLDLNLPDSVGLDTVRQVLREHPAVPVVVLTGAEIVETAVQAVREGAADYLFKGRLDGPLLIRAIRFAVERSGSRRTQARLQETEERFRDLVETTSDWIWEIDLQGLFTYSSPRVTDLLGYSPAELLGRSLFDLVRAEDEPRFRESVTKSLRAGSPIVCVEHTNLHRDGRPVVLETSAVPVFGPDGQLRQYRGSDRDITVVKEALDSVRERERRYRQLLAAVTTYTYSVQLEGGRCTWTTHGDGCFAVTGYFPDDYRADAGLWISMVHPDDREAVLRYIDGALAGDDGPPIEHRILHRNGSTRWVRSTIVLHKENGTIVRYDGLVEDITERKRAERALKKKELQLLAAQKIQERLLPHEAPSVPGYDVAGFLCPAEFAAGDYYDFLPMPDGSLALAIGDVSGHGFASALIMASVHVLLRLLVESHANLNEILALANSVVVREIEEGRFVSLLLARLDPTAGTITYANAGHPPGFLLDAAGKVKVRLTATGLPLGVTSDRQDTVNGPLALKPGDTLIMVTDGINESRDPDGTLFGFEGILRVARDHLQTGAAELSRAVCIAAREFCKRSSPADDTTAVVVKVNDTPA